MDLSQQRMTTILHKLNYHPKTIFKRKMKVISSHRRKLKDLSKYDVNLVTFRQDEIYANKNAFHTERPDFR